MKGLKVLVVGAGIGGLSTALALATNGHEVTVIESVKEFLQVGAGIRVPPNSSRLSQSWGVDFSKIKTSTASGLRFLDWEGNVLIEIDYTSVQAKYGAPYLFVHRADLIDLLVQTSSQHSNITLRMNSKVQAYDFEAPALTLTTGEHLKADLIICADGIKSAVRNVINGTPIEPQDTGDVAYRVLVPAEHLRNDPDLRPLLANGRAMHWLGPEAHAVGYALRDGEMYNIIIDITHNTDVGKPIGDEEWRSQADNTELVRRFADWCPPVRKLCGLTDSYLKWKLADFDHLRQWVHPSGKVAILGDACHPMIPYMAQGAAQATEDAATLAAALHDHNNLETALHAYERQRLPRATHVAKNTRILQAWWHLYDGSERAKRDEAMRHDNFDNPIFWANSQRLDWLFGHDATRLVTEDELQPPPLAPMPADEALVYNITDSDLRRRFQNMRSRN